MAAFAVELGSLYHVLFDSFSLVIRITKVSLHGRFFVEFGSSASPRLNSASIEPSSAASVHNLTAFRISFCNPSSLWKHYLSPRALIASGSFFFTRARTIASESASLSESGALQKGQLDMPLLFAAIEQPSQILFTQQQLMLECWLIGNGIGRVQIGQKY